MSLKLLYKAKFVHEEGLHNHRWACGGLQVTVRLTPDGCQVLGIYYSAHRWGEKEEQGVCD